MTFKVGDRVVLVKDWDKDVSRGTTGVIDTVECAPDSIGVRLDPSKNSWDYIYVMAEQICHDVLHNSPLMKALR